MCLHLLASKALEGRIYNVSGSVAASIGVHKSTMELYKYQDTYFIEWDAPTADFTTNIGLTIIDNTLEDYDGIYSLPHPAIDLLREAGIIVSEEFI